MTNTPPRSWAACYERRLAPRSTLRHGVWASLAIATATLTAGQPSHAQSGLVIDVDPTVTLTCLARVTFSASSSVMTQLFAGTPGGDVAITTPSATTTTSYLGNDINVALTGLNSDPTTDPDAITGTVTACRIDGTPLPGNYQVDVSLTGNTTLDGPGGSNVSVNTIGARLNGQNGGYRQSFTFPGRTFRRNPSVFLDFQIGFDLSNAAQSGTHSSANSGTFTVTVTAP